MGLLKKRTPKAPELKTCRPKSNLMGSFSIKKEYEADYQKLREFLYYNHMSIGEYLIESYRVLDKEE